MKIEQRYLPINQYTRPGRKQHDIKAIVVHWTEYPCGDVPGLYSWFAFDAVQIKRYCSAHFGVGLSGQIWQFMPIIEVAYHVGSDEIDPISGKIYTDYARHTFGQEYCDNKPFTPNYKSIGIEVCHPLPDGRPNRSTEESLIDLIAGMKSFMPDVDICTHYDIVGYKKCHKYYVENQESFDRLKRAVESRS